MVLLGKPRRMAINIIRSLRVVAVLVTAGCVTTSSLQQGEKLTAADAVVIIGISPKTSVGISKGSREGSDWAFDRFSGQIARVSPQDGYIVVRLPVSGGNVTYGVSSAGQTSVTSFDYFACNGDEVYTFALPRSGAVYVGDLKFVDKTAGTRLEYRRDFEKMARTLAARYPELRGQISQSELTPLKASNRPCTRMTPS
jgi:hypothetical protein